jgi:hypothetical protein
MKPRKQRTYDGHIADFDRDHRKPSYQSKGDRQNLRQDGSRSTHNFKREDLGFINRDTRGYDKHHGGKY